MLARDAPGPTGHLLSTTAKEGADMLADESEGSRREVSGVRSLTDAEEALAMLRGIGAQDKDQLHVYLSGTSFSFWVGRSEGEE